VITKPPGPRLFPYYSLLAVIAVLLAAYREFLVTASILAIRSAKGRLRIDIDVPADPQESRAQALRDDLPQPPVPDSHLGVHGVNLPSLGSPTIVGR